MGTYKQNRTWSDAFLPEMKTIIGKIADEGLLRQYRPHIVRTSTVVEDTEHATDLVVTSSGINIACRVRKNSKIKFQEITIRSLSRAGYTGKTELEKLLDGEGDYMLYCHTDKSEKSIRRYILIDLFYLRTYITNNREDLPTIRNTDKYGRYDGTGFISVSLHNLLKESPAAVVCSLPYIDEYMGLTPLAKKKSLFWELQNGMC